MTSNSVRRAITLQASDLLCSNHCGFYGNPSWNGYCSVCYREVYLKPKLANEAVESKAKRKAAINDASSCHGITNTPSTATIDPMVADPNLTQNTSSATKSVAAFTKFEQKRKKVAGKSSQTVSNLFRKTKDSGNADSANTSPQPQSTVSSANSSPVMERQSVTDSLLDGFLRSLPRAAALDISKQVNAVMDRLHEHRANTCMTVSEVADIVQEYYKAMFDRLNCHVFYRGINDMYKDKIMDAIELYVMSRLYRSVFNGPDDEASDLSIQARIRSLHWISADMLGAAIDEEVDTVQTRMFDSMTALIELNNCRSPQEKLACIVRSCKALMEALSASQQARPISADDFLPALIMTVLRTNPPLLHSNLRYITRFAYSPRLDAGETGYFFTTFSCAVHFLERVDAEQLGMSSEEFNSYVNGTARPPVTSRNNVSDALTNDFTGQLHNRLEIVESQQKEFLTRLENVEHQWRHFHVDISDRAEALRKQYPFEIRVRETPEKLRQRLLKPDATITARENNFDAPLESSVVAALPDPLLPSGNIITLLD